MATEITILTNFLLGVELVKDAVCFFFLESYISGW